MYHCGFSRQASADSYAMDSRRLGVGSAEDLLNIVLEIHFATCKTALRPPGAFRLLQRIRLSCLSVSHGVFLQLNYGVVVYKRGRSSPASAKSQSSQRTPQRPPPTPCKPCRAGRIKPSLPNQMLLRTRRIVKTTSRQAATTSNSREQRQKVV